MKKALTLTVTLFTAQLVAFCQQRQDILNYIAKYKDIAIEEMVRCKIPASITLAQGIHESSWGKSDLSQQANNHFGIKCKSDWEGKKFFKNDDAPNECFRVYEHAFDSYIDHSDFLVTRSRYAPLFELPITDYKSWANGLKSYGYATNPKYPQILVTTIETYNLAEFDQVGIAMIKQNENLLNPTVPPVELMAENAPVKPTPAAPVAKPEVAVEKVEVHQKTAPPAPAPSYTPVTTTTAIIGNNATATAKIPATTPVNKTAPVATSSKPNNASANATVNEKGRKEYLVNGIRTLRSEGNENPLTIAIDYDLDFGRVLAMNDLGPDEHFKNGENIFLQPKKARGAEESYIVQPGESMRDISQKLGVKLKELYLKNEMIFVDNEQVMAGEKLYLQDKRMVAPKTISYTAFLKTQNAEKNNTAFNLNKNATGEATQKDSHESTARIPQPNNQYQVQQSDTLYSIARKFNLSVEQLKAINNLREDNPLHAGQTLLVSK